MATLGNFALIFGLAMAAAGTIASLMAAVMARESFRKTAIRAYTLSAASTLTAIITLGVMLQKDTFSNVYVYGHSNLALDTIFKVTAIWAGSEGSLLWWTLILMIYATFFLFLTRKAPRLMTSWALFIIGLNLCFFLVINNVVANPFATWNQIGAVGEPLFSPADGRGMNPQLQHWAMIIHPPMLYTGYIGFLFPFALALGALITRQEAREWLPIVRRWTLAAWLILGVGIVLGGAWAYMELGWGGYWAWDPVENASFMPWLLATAFLHSLMAQERRGMFKLWNLLLLIGSYLMCLFGTFITRSGLISSVHAFAASSIGNYFIAFIGVLTVISAVVLIMRRSELSDDNAYVSAASREVGLLFNNVLFVAICGLILLGVLFPMIHEYLYDTKRELRHGYYNVVVLPFFLVMMLAMAIGPVLTWKRTSTRLLRERFLWPTIIMIPIGIAVGYYCYIQGSSWFPAASAMVLSFLLYCVVQEFWEAVSGRMKRASENAFSALVSVVRRNKRRYGGYIVHLSVLFIALGITGAAFNEQAKEELGIGGVMEIAGYSFMVENIAVDRNDNYESMHATVNLMKDGKVINQFHPEQRFYFASESQASEVSIGTTLARDFYVVLAGPGEGYSKEHPIAIFHVYVNPLVMWVWVGTFLMIFGTAITLIPEKSKATAKAAVKQSTVGDFA